jgi:hypothetical protein
MPHVAANLLLGASQVLPVDWDGVRGRVMQKQKLTKRTIDSIKRFEIDCFLWDSELVGFGGTAFAFSQLNYFMSARRDLKGRIDTVRLNAMIAVVEGVKPANEVHELPAPSVAPMPKVRGADPERQTVQVSRGTR